MASEMFAASEEISRGTRYAAVLARYIQECNRVRTRCRCVADGCASEMNDRDLDSMSLNAPKWRAC